MDRARAGDNERRFRELCARGNGVQLLGKRRFATGDVNISVDESLLHKGTEYLVEVDSGNMAKLLVGQYVLLNQLYRPRPHQPFFLVVHTYGSRGRGEGVQSRSLSYNPARTVNNLQLVNQQLYGGNGIPFAAVHLDSLADWSDDFEDMLNRCKYPDTQPRMREIVAERSSKVSPGDG